MEHSFCRAIETLEGTVLSTYSKASRTLLLEITRILNHLLAITCFAMDTGALTPFLFAFEDREKLLEIIERITGARMHCNFFQPGGQSKPLPLHVLDSIAS